MKDKQQMLTKNGVHEMNHTDVSLSKDEPFHKNYVEEEQILGDDMLIACLDMSTKMS